MVNVVCSETICKRRLEGKSREADISHLSRIWRSHSGGYKEFHLLGYNAVWSIESQPMSPPSSRSNNKPSKNSICYLLHIGFLLGLFLDPGDGGHMFLRNVGWLSMDYMAICPKRQNYSSYWFPAWLIRRPWRWRPHVPPKRRLTFNGLHCDIPQKAELFFILVSCLGYSSTLEMEATCFSETSVDFEWTTRRYIPEGRTLHNA
jgi:hypothetical protein